jgi:hypothetical protein
MTENTMDVLPLMPEQLLVVEPAPAFLELLPGEPPQPEPELPPGPAAVPVPGGPRTGRIFAPEQEPLADGGLYTSLDGTAYFRPTWRVGRRAPGLLAGPDVWFDRGDDGAPHLRWTLTQVRPPGAPADARSLVIGIESVTIVWNGGSHTLPATGPGPDLAPVLPLLPEQAHALELAMSDAASGCRVEVAHTVHYRVPVEPARLDGEAPPTAAEREEYVPVRLSVPFVFNPNDDANRPVYRALHGVAALTDTWQKSSAGWLRSAPFPNTVYRLPDEVRLAFDPDLGTPHVVTTLHTDDQGRASVRVLLRVAPWQDRRRVIETRALTGLAGARVIVGPVSGATLRLGGSFPDGIRMLGGGDGVAVPLAEGAELLMDLTLEYFQLLCSLIGGAVGLPGTVEVRLTDSGADTVVVPLVLRMDRVDELPVSVEPAPVGPAGSPRSVVVRNLTGTAIRAGGCHAVFLRTEGRTGGAVGGAVGVVPVASYPARCTSAFPLELPAGGTAELTVEPVEPVEPGEGDSWNAVLVELLDRTMVQDARTALTRAQRLAGSGELTWDLTVSTPVFSATELPARWATLASIEVEVSAPGFETTTVVLRRDTPVRTLLMRAPLAALVAGDASGIRTATYRVRNNHLDGQGPWSAPQQQSGEELVVFPTGSATAAPG